MKDILKSLIGKLIIRRNPAKLSYGKDYSYSVKGHWKHERHEHKKPRSLWTPVKLIGVYSDGRMLIENRQEIEQLIRDFNKE